MVKGEVVSFIVSLFPTAIFFTVNSYLILTWTKIYFSGIESGRTTRVCMKSLFVVTNAICIGLIVAEMIFAGLGSSEGKVMNDVRCQCNNSGVILHCLYFDSTGIV